MTQCNLLRAFPAIFILFVGFPLNLSYAEPTNLPENTDDLSGQLYRELKFKDPAVRYILLSNFDKFKSTIDSLYRRNKLMQEAARLKVEEDERVLYYLDMARKDVLIQATKKKVADSLRVPNVENLARDTYKTNLEDYVEPEKVQVAHILIRVEKDVEKEAKRRQAEELLDSLKNGGDFAELARLHSDDGSATNGGDLGLFPRGKMVKPFENAAFSLEAVGDVSGIVETEYGFHIIKLLNRTPSRQMSFEEVKFQIIAELEKNYRKQGLKAWFKKTVGKTDDYPTNETLKIWFEQMSKAKY